MFSKARVDIAFLEERKARWEFAGRAIRGDEAVYLVVDANYQSRREWEFIVRTPHTASGGSYIEVRPQKVPNRKAWARLHQRTVQFRRATIGKHRSKVYCKVTIEDVSGERTKRVLSDTRTLPAWLRKAPRLLRKNSVIRSKANDGNHLVALFKPDDHAEMIRLFLAAKAWVRDSGFNPDTARLRRRHRKRPELAGLRVVITGKLGYGIRRQAQRWLRRLGAKVRTLVTGKTDLLIVGAHFLEQDRGKIKLAEKLGVRRMSEARFMQAYQLW